MEGDVSDHEFDFYINRPITFKRVSELNDCSAIVYYSLGIYREEGYDKESGEPMYLQDGFSEQKLFPKDGWLSVPVYLTRPDERGSCLPALCRREDFFSSTQCVFCV